MANSPPGTKFLSFFRQWIIENSPLDVSCPGNMGSIEKCLTPSIPNCVDRNIYCDSPPATFPSGTTSFEVVKNLLGDGKWLNLPDTTLKYTCKNSGWAFSYQTDPRLPSFYFAENINNITISCNKNGFVLNSCFLKDLFDCDKIEIYPSTQFHHNKIAKDFALLIIIIIYQ